MSEIKEGILNILQELHSDVAFEEEKNMVGDKILDSFDLVTLVSELSAEFDIEITARDFVPENFNSLDALEAMVERLMDE